MSDDKNKNGEMIRVENLSFKYPEGDNYIIKGLSCSFRRGEVTAVTGRNGCGKTTLARLLTGVFRPESGRVVICEGTDGDIDTADMSLSAIGRTVGFVYQDPTRQLFCETVYEEIAYGLRNRKKFEKESITEEEIDRRVVSAMEYFRLSEKADEYPGTMSQGEKQRVMLAAVTALDTQYIILDEPTSGLDMEGCKRLGELMRDMSARGAGVVMISHERSFIDEYADCEIKLEEINNTKNIDNVNYNVAPYVARFYKRRGPFPTFGGESIISHRNPGGAEAPLAPCHEQPGKNRKSTSHRKSLLSALDARSRMVASVCIVMVSVLSRDPGCLLCVLAFTAVLIGAGGAGIMNPLYRIRGMVGLALSLFILQCIFVRSGDALITVKSITLVTSDGMSMAAVSALRLMILTFTALIMAAGDMRSCIAALSQMRLPYDIVFMVMAALKFLPFLREESTDVMNASKMRGAAFDEMNMMERAQFYLRLVVPVTAGAIRRADKMNIAMAARGFRAFDRRTRFFSVRMHAYDWVFMILIFIISLMLMYVF